MVYMICTMSTQYNNTIKMNVEKKRKNMKYQTSTRYHNKKYHTDVLVLLYCYSANTAADNFNRIQI